MSNNINIPPTFPLQGTSGGFDCRLSNPNGKLSDSWLQKSLISNQYVQPESRENRKRIRNVGDSENNYDNNVESGAESCDDMMISDSDSQYSYHGGGNLQGLNNIPSGVGNTGSGNHDGHVHPPKRRLMSVGSTSTIDLQSYNPQQLVDENKGCESRLLAHPQHPHTPSAFDSPSITPICDIEDDQPQQLPLPSPSASPVQSGASTISGDIEDDKPPIFHPIASDLAKIPSTQGELLDVMVNLSSYLNGANKNYLIFQLLQNVNRSSLSSFNSLIHNSLRRDLLSNLPLEVAYSVLSHLDYKSLLSVSLVCTNWNKIINNVTLWSNLLKKDKLLDDDYVVDEELSDPKKLIREWAADPNYQLKNLSMAQLLYKKRLIIFRRWMTPWYTPKRISVPGDETKVVTCLQHDSEKIIIGNEDRLINIYSTRTGELLKVLRGHEGGVWALKYYGNTLVSGSTDRTVRVWNIKTGKCTHVLKGHTSTVRCLDILHPVVIGKNDKGEDIIFPETPLLVTGSRDHNLHVWKLPLDNEDDASEPKEQQIYDSSEPNNPYFVVVLTGHTQSVRSVTGYGNLIISGSYDTTVRVWDLLDGGRCRFSLEGHSDRIYSTALNFHKKRCYSGSMDSSINVWDTDKGELLYSLEGHSSLVGLLELSENYLVSAAADATLRVWDPQSPENYSKLRGHNNAITCFQHDSLRIVSGSERMLKLWNIETGQFVRDLLTDITGGIWQVRFDCNRCVAAVQRTRNDKEETFIEILDFSAPPSRKPNKDGRKTDVIELLSMDEHSSPGFNENLTPTSNSSSSSTDDIITPDAP